MNSVPASLTVTELESIGSQLRKYKSGELHTINFSGVGQGVDDSMIQRLAGHTRLVELNLDNSEITDLATGYLTGHMALRTLHLQNTQLTDACLSNLLQLQQLQLLVLTGTQITTAAVARMRSAMLNTRIILNRTP